MFNQIAIDLVLMPTMLEDYTGFGIWSITAAEQWLNTSDRVAQNNL